VSYVASLYMLFAKEHHERSLAETEEEPVAEETDGNPGVRACPRAWWKRPTAGNKPDPTAPTNRDARTIAGLHRRQRRNIASPQTKSPASFPTRAFAFLLERISWPPIAPRAL